MTGLKNAQAMTLRYFNILLLLILVGSAHLVLADNLPPIPGDDYATTLEDEPVGVTVLLNDYDPDGTVIPTTVTLAGWPQHGFAVVDELNGVVFYLPDPDFNGNDSVPYQVCDNEGACAVAMIYLTVLPVNDPPNVRRDFVQVYANELSSIDPLANDDDDRDPGSGIDPFSGAVLIQAIFGEASLMGDQWTYSPEPGYVGLDSFLYRICDLGLPLPALCGEAWFVIQVLPHTGPSRSPILDLEFSPDDELSVESIVNIPAPFQPGWVSGIPREPDFPGAVDNATEYQTLSGHQQLSQSEEYAQTPDGLFQWSVERHSEDFNSLLQVFDTNGRLLGSVSPFDLKSSLNGNGLEFLGLEQGLYFYVWWEDPALNPRPQKSGPWVITR